MAQKRKILIVGGCGFIGCNLITYLNQQTTANITVFDNELTGSKNNLKNLRVAKFIHGDIRDKKAINDATIGHDTVVLLAAQTNVMLSIQDPELDLEVNIKGGLNTLMAAKMNGVKRFIFASSAAPVGMQNPPMHEELAARPASPYGASKLAMEGYCSAFYHSYGLETIPLSFSNCYGPGSDSKLSVVALFLRCILSGDPITIFGDGTQTRDFIYVDDLCRAIALAISHPDHKDVFGSPYHVGTSVETSINELVKLFSNQPDPKGITKLNVNFKPSRAGEIIRNYSDIRKFKKIFDFEPKFSTEDGIKHTWQYFYDKLSK